MMKANVLPEVWFGGVGPRGIDWRKTDMGDGMDDYDDDGPTPPDVIKILGFDPDEFSEKKKTIGLSAIFKYSEDQPRDEHGRFGSGDSAPSTGWGQEHARQALESMSDKEKQAYAEKFGRKGAGEGKEVGKLAMKELAYALTESKFGFVSAGPNSYLDPKDAKESFYKDRNAQLKDELIQKGYVFTPVAGHYGGKEDSYMVMMHDANRSDLISMGKQFGQQSVLYGEKGNNQMVQVTTGQFKAGGIWEGKGFQLVPKQDDYYSEIQIKEGGSAKVSVQSGYDGESPPSRYEKIKNLLELLAVFKRI